MGWSVGSDLAHHVWLVVREHLPIDKRQDCAQKILDLFRDHDADSFGREDQLLADAGETWMD